MNRTACDKCGDPQFEPFGQFQACPTCIADIRSRCRHSHDFDGRPHYPKVTVRMRCWACAGTGYGKVRELASVGRGTVAKVQESCRICAGEGSKSVTYSTEPEPFGEDYAGFLDNAHAAADFGKDVRPPGAR